MHRTLTLLPAPLQTHARTRTFAIIPRAWIIKTHKRQKRRRIRPVDSADCGTGNGRLKGQ